MGVLTFTASRRMVVLLGCILPLLINGAFVLQPHLALPLSRPSHAPRQQRPKSLLLQAFANWNTGKIDAVREEKTRAALIQALVRPEGKDPLLQVYLAGRTKIPTSRNNTVPCLVLAPTPSTDSPVPCLAMPITDTQLRLLSFAYVDKPLTKSVCLTLNPLLVNRDGSLFDNLPWSTWTVDPQKRNRDAAKNAIDPKFHLGKRDAYNRMMGRDWKGRSVSLGNMALRLKYLLESERNDDDDTPRLEQDKETWQAEDTSVLAKRVLDLQIRELQMELAEWDYQLAVARNSPMLLEELQTSRQDCQDRIVEAQDALVSLEKPQEGSATMLNALLDRVAAMTTDEGRNAAPYRGAMGYAPMLDSKEDIETSFLPCTSPYDLLRDIIGDQLNADVIGTVLENTSLREGTLVLGGAVVLRRRAAKKTMILNGQELSVDDDDEDFGNQGIKGGETFLVECDGDEAIGMALASKVPIRVENNVWERSNLMAVPVAKTEEVQGVFDSLPMWEPEDKEMSFLVEGQARNESTTSSTSSLRIPQTTSSLFDSIFEPSSSSSSSSPPLFPTDNPIQSLTEYDALSNADKASTLMSLSNFAGKLPRPRVLRQFDPNGISPNPLDQLLLPLIDESVRRQYLIRDAERRGDIDALEQLKSSKSMRQIAKEKAEEARESGAQDVAEWWENEAKLYGSLRADVTQNEGTYSRFLDKDEWYERDRQALAKRIKRSSFGTLLDGIE